MNKYDRAVRYALYNYWNNFDIDYVNHPDFNDREDLRLIVEAIGEKEKRETGQVPNYSIEVEKTIAQRPKHWERCPLCDQPLE